MKKNFVEMPTLDKLYKVTPMDFQRTATMLGEAFQDDPVWGEILKGRESLFPFVFATPIKYAMKFGGVYAPDSSISAAAVWVPTPYVEINFLRILQSRSFSVAMKFGMKLGRQVFKVFKQINKDRQHFMRGEFIYLMVLGVAPDHQRKGLGSQLVKTMQENLPPNVPIYLETESEANVRFYERLGFDVLKKIDIPLDPPKPMWEMLYQP